MSPVRSVRRTHPPVESETAVRELFVSLRPKVASAVRVGTRHGLSASTGRNHRADNLGGGGQASESVSHASKKDTSVWTETEMVNNRPTPNQVELARGVFPDKELHLRHGMIAIAAITSCTNTSNPSVMLAAGLLARKAAEKGIAPPPYVKTSLAPGSRVVTEYLEKAGLLEWLNRIGFNLVGYGCTTCIGNSGPLDPHIEAAIAKHELVLASVLSGNRNFEARIHQSVKANFLMSPPLVIAFALAGRVDIDMNNEPLGKNAAGEDVYLRDIWPDEEEIQVLVRSAFDAETYRKMYSDFSGQNPLWNDIPAGTGGLYGWNKDRPTYRNRPISSGSRWSRDVSRRCGARVLLPSSEIPSRPIT